jgi:hypothetical protein
MHPRHASRRHVGAGRRRADEGAGEVSNMLGDVLRELLGSGNRAQ